jgi:magnesium transporter
MAASSLSVPRFFFISELVRDQVFQQPRHVLGTLSDLEIKLEGRYPEVVNLIVSRPFGRLPLVVPFGMVQSIDTHRTVVDVPPGTVLSEYRQNSERVLVKDMVLDKRIIDTDEYEVEVVYDIHLLYADRRLHVIHVDVSNAGLLRRLHFGWLARLLYGDLKQLKLLPWRYVQPLPSDLGRFQGDVKLNISREKIADIHPSDLADIMEELSGEERIAVFNTLDTETAADALEETEPRVQRQLVATVRRERIVELLNTMTPAQIADILEILPRVEAEALRSSLAPETGATVAELLSRHEVRLSSLTTKYYLALPEGATVADAIARFRDRRRRYDVVMYVYVVNEAGMLKGVVDIRELIQANSETPLGAIMTSQVVSLSPHDTLADAAREFNQYGFRALPMVDEGGKLIGAVKNKDLLAVED